jgi:hypothetical protein
MDDLLTRADVARILNKPESWLRYSERHRLIKYIKVGAHIRYRREDVEQWLATREVTPTEARTVASKGERTRKRPRGGRTSKRSAR